MPKIEKKKKKKNAKRRIFTAVFERTVFEYEKVGLKAWF
jgi:hypothetical protein